jgi:DNA polymerase-3 subunit gamma/tau
MAYQVLARKWRPRNFSEMVGQAHVLRALTNALKNNRLHHAYLFTGTRGVGKTTIARILAKSLNCESGITAYPCGQCKICREIDQGRFVDLIEVDAASRTKVEDTRELLDNVQYAPTRGRYKVYLIDEVHMLSNHSFNALLKTLEEPPPHIKFLLATTDPQKLPPTILSRCLQFNLKRLPLEAITQHLQKILTTEHIDHEIQALQLLAQAADGSVRDALSLLDQAIAYGAGQLLTADVKEMLGTQDQHAVEQMVAALAANDAPNLLHSIAQLAEHNPDYLNVLGEILSFLQKIALEQAIPGTIDPSHPENESMLQLAQQLSPEDVQLFYQIGLLGRRDLPLAPEARGGFEMIMLRMLAFRPANMSVPVQSPSIVHSSSAKTHTPTPIANHSPNPALSPTTTSSSATGNTLNEQWSNLVHSLNLGNVVSQLAINCELKQKKGKEGEIWHLVLSSHYEFLYSESRKQQLEKSIQQQLGASQRIIIDIEASETETPAKQQQIQDTRQEYVVNEINSDPFIMYLKEHCQAKVKEVKVVDNGVIRFEM